MSNWVFIKIFSINRISCIYLPVSSCNKQGLDSFVCMGNVSEHGPFVKKRNHEQSQNYTKNLLSFHIYPWLLLLKHGLLTNQRQNKLFGPYFIPISINHLRFFSGFAAKLAPTNSSRNSMYHQMPPGALDIYPTRSHRASFKFMESSATIEKVEVWPNKCPPLPEEMMPQTMDLGNKVNVWCLQSSNRSVWLQDLADENPRALHFQVFKQFVRPWTESWQLISVGKTQGPSTICWTRTQKYCSWQLVGGWTTQLKNMLVKLDHLPR